MFRLKFRKSGAGIAAIILGAILIIATPYIAAVQGLCYDFPWYWIVGGETLLVLLFALVNYRTVPFIQQVRVLLVTASIIGLFGVIANSNFPITFRFFLVQQDWLMHFHAVVLGIMNLAGFIAAINFMQAEQMSSFADTKVAEAQLERLKAVKVDPDTQAKWEKAASFADRSTDGRSLRSTMTNLKAISLAEPGQELKPKMPEGRKEKEKEAGKDKAAGGANEESLSSLLDRMEDAPLEADAKLSAIRSNPALSGNSFINDAADKEPVDTGASFLDKMLNDKLAAEEPAVAAGDAEFETPYNFAADLGLPADDSETVDVAALLDSFPDDASGEEPSAGAPAVEPPAPEPQTAAEEKFEAKPKATLQVDKLDTSDAVETTRSSSFANASSSRTSLPALQPLHEGAPEIAARTGDSASAGAAGSQAPTPSAAPASPTNTNNKLAAMKRRNTSTFTKLNALSASGTGSLLPPKQDMAEEPDGLKGLLDRLDDEQDAAVPAAKPVEEAAKPIEPPVELIIDTVFREDGTPEVAPTPSSVAVRPAEAKVEAKVEPPVEEAVAATVEEAPEAAHEERVEETAIVSSEIDSEAAPLASLLDRSLGEEEEEASFQQETLTESLSGSLSQSLSGSLSESLMAPEEEALAESRENVFGGGVDSDIDNIFSELAPPEAQLEVKDAKLSAREEAKPAEEDQNEGMPTFSASESLFAGGVDNDLDNIFSEMAPRAAQEALSSSTAGGAKAEAVADRKEEVAEIEAKHDESLKEEAPEAEDEDKSALFGGGVDSEIDDIFSELAPPEAQKEVKDMRPAGATATAEPAKAEEKSQDFAPAAEAEEAPAAEGGLFGDDLGQELDNIFSGLTESQQLEVTASTLAKVKTGEGADEEEKAVVAPAPVEKPVVAEAPAAVAASAASPSTAAKPEAPKYKEVKEFGRLSAKTPSTSKFAGETSGTMKTIGKLLLDVQAVENIIKSGETKKIGSGLSTAKVISAARGEGIKNILNAIDTYEGVAGSLIVGHDGLVIASTVGTGWDKDMLGALSTALLSTSNLATKKLEIGKLRQMVMLTQLTNGNGDQFKTTVLTDVDVGILAVFLEKTELAKIDGLLDTIQTTIHGG